MSAKSSNLPNLNGIQANHGVLIRERENLGLFLHHLGNELADQHCEIQADKDIDFAYFDIKLPWEWNDIDICVHGGHVVVRMVRLE